MHEAEQALHLAGHLAELAWEAAESAIKQLVNAFSGDDLCDDGPDTSDPVVSVPCMIHCASCCLAWPIAAVRHLV